MLKDIRIIALDLDGTLTNEEKIITPRTYRVLMEVQRRGIRLCLASGRPPYGMRPLANQLHLSEYDGLLLCYNGGHVELCNSGLVIFHKELPAEYIEELYSFQNENFTLMTYYEDLIYTERPKDKYVLQSAKNNAMTSIGVENFVRDTPRPLNKCLLVGPPDLVPQQEILIKEQMKGKINVCHSTPYFIELLPLNIDKGSAIVNLIETFGMHADQMLSFGDSNNDISMLKVSGTGVAMGNAEESVKAVADYITVDNENDGVAEFIEKYLLI